MARVWTAARSEPAVGSDRAIAPIHLPLAERRSSASRRASSIVCVPSPWPRAKMLPTESQARASSSEIRQYSNTPSPIPPCSAGTVRPNQPFAAIWSIRLRGISAFWGSSSSAIGSTTSWANVRASICSSTRAAVRQGGCRSGGCGSRRVLVGVFSSRVADEALWRQRRRLARCGGGDFRSQRTGLHLLRQFPCFASQTLVTRLHQQQNNLCQLHGCCVE